MKITKVMKKTYYLIFIKRIEIFTLASCLYVYMLNEVCFVLCSFFRTGIVTPKAPYGTSMDVCEPVAAQSWPGRC